MVTKNLKFAPNCASALLLFLLGFSGPAFAQAPSDNPLQLSPPRTVTMVVANLDKEAAWYETVLGFHDTKKFRAANPNATEKVMRIELAGFRLDLVEHKGSRRPAPLEDYKVGTNVLQGYSHISFESTTLDETYKWLTAHGVADIDVARDKTTNALKMMRFQDPEGNEIHIELPN